MGPISANRCPVRFIFFDDILGQSKMKASAFFRKWKLGKSITAANRIINIGYGDHKEYMQDCLD